LLKDLKKSCPKLERIVLEFIGSSSVSQELEDYLFSFTSGMEHLEFVYLMGFKIEPARAEVLMRKLNETFLPLRPSFWCYVGGLSVEANYPLVPRVHFQEMIDPYAWLHSPIKF